jgi:FdhD protein
MKQADLSGYLIYPNPDNASLTSEVTGRDHTGAEVDVDVVTERGLTVYLNKQEIVTLMTLGDHAQYLAVGFLLNQNMLQADDVITAIDYDEELEVAIVRTQRETDYEDKMKKKVRTSGCAQGTVFGDIMNWLKTPTSRPVGCTSLLGTSTPPQVFIKRRVRFTAVSCVNENNLWCIWKM